MRATINTINHFVRTVRKTCGDNTARWFMIPGLAARSLPDCMKDNHARRRSVDLHHTFLIGRYAVPYGLPIILTEFGAVAKIDKTHNDAERIMFAATFMRYVNALGIPCVWWNNKSPQRRWRQVFRAEQSANADLQHPERRRVDTARGG